METLFGLLPIALIALACPLMMIFMMRGGHGGHGSHAGHAGHTDAGDDGDARARLQSLEREVEELRLRVGATEARNGSARAAPEPAEPQRHH